MAGTDERERREVHELENRTGDGTFIAAKVAERRVNGMAASLNGMGLIGRKIGMTQVYTETGEVQTVTVIQLGPCTVLQVKTKERDGYEAVQLGFGDKSRYRASRSERGHVAAIDSKRQKSRAEAGVAPVAKANCEPQREIREFRTSGEGYTVGQVLDVAMFDGVVAIDVTGTSKGRGTAGVMKRLGFHGQRASLGAKQVHRQAGSTGCNTSPARIFKGRRMAGRYGAERITTRNLKVVVVDKEEGLLLVRGAVPGHNNGVVMVRPTNKVG